MFPVFLDVLEFLRSFSSLFLLRFHRRGPFRSNGAFPFLVAQELRVDPDVVWGLCFEETSEGRDPGQWGGFSLLVICFLLGLKTFEGLE